MIRSPLVASMRRLWFSSKMRWCTVQNVAVGKTGARTRLGLFLFVDAVQWVPCGAVLWLLLCCGVRCGDRVRLMHPRTATPSKGVARALSLPTNGEEQEKGLPRVLAMGKSRLPRVVYRILVERILLLFFLGSFFYRLINRSNQSITFVPFFR